MIEFKVGDCVKFSTDFEHMKKYMFIVIKVKKNRIDEVFLEPTSLDMQEELEEEYEYNFDLPFNTAYLEYVIPKDVSLKIFEDEKYKDIFE